MSKPVKRPGAGRTKGSFSFVKLTLAELEAKLGSDPTTQITVGRKWAEALGFKVTSAPANEIAGSIEGTAPGQGVVFEKTQL